MKIDGHHPMLAICLLAWVIFTLPNSIAETPQDRVTISALRSFTPVVLYQNEFHPIIGVKKRKPLIDIAGQSIVMPKKSTVFFWSHKAAKKPTLLTRRHVSRLDTGISHGLSGASLGGLSGGGGKTVAAITGARNASLPGVEGNQITRDEHNEIVDNDQTQFWEYITSTNGALKDSYVVFIFYSEKGLAELQWRNLKDTPEGTPRAIRIPYPSRKSVKKHKNPRYIFLVFQNGEELVPSDDRQRIEFLSWNEITTMSRISKNHEKANPQNTLEPSLIFKPDFILSESTYEQLIDKEILAHITVNELGTVSEAYLDSSLGSATASEVLKSLRLWKFLPAIKNGQRIEQKIRIPLQF